MARVIDVAEHILRGCGPLTAMKLQKLVYYAQAWSLVWDERPLFDARIEAWANGPVVPYLYQRHRIEYEVRPGHFDGDPSALSDTESETVDAVVSYYGNKSTQWLSDLTHQEEPWRRARAQAGLAPGERGTVIIPHAAMAEYYGSL